MTTYDICAEISKRTGIPIAKVSTVIHDYCTDMRTLVNTNAVGTIRFYNVGNLHCKYKNCQKEMETLLNDLSKLLRKYYEKLITHTSYRKLFTLKCDKFYAMATTITEAKLLLNKEYYSGFSARRKQYYDPDLFKEHMARMEIILESFPSTLIRTEPSKISQINLRNMSKKGVLQYPKIKDCEVYPMSLYT